MRRGWPALHLITLLLASLSGLVASTGQAQVPVERFALVIGNNQPEAGSAASALRYADDDALATHRLLLEAGVHSRLLVRLDADSERLAAGLVPDGAPTASALEATFAELVAHMRAQAQRGAEVELSLFFSGHGDVAGGEGFVLLEDARLTRQRLFELLSRSPALRNHVFIDACKSYFLVFERGPGGRRSPYAGAPLREAIPAQLDNTGFVLSTSSDRDSHEWERYQGGILSHELRSALRGAADTNGDARISYAELGAFLTKANQAIDNPRFRPDFMVRAPHAELQSDVLRWSGRSPAAFVGETYLGPFYVETARGARLLDAHPGPGQRLALWLSDERPLFLRRKDERGEAVIDALAPRQVAALEPARPQLLARGALSLALDNLFAAPFADEDVRAFERRASLSTPAPSTAEEATTAPSTGLRSAAGWVALAAEGAGLSLNAIALTQYLRAGGESQRRLQTLNERSRALNHASIALHATALAAGVAWAWLTFGPKAPLGVVPLRVTGSAPLGLGLEGCF